MSEPLDDDLPGLLAWGDELREATARAEQHRARRRRLPVRRLAPAVAALLVLVPGAVATRSIWDDPFVRVDPGTPDPATPAVRLAEGSAGDVRWRLGGYDAGTGQVCTRLEAFRGTRRIVAGRACATPQTRGGLSVMLVPAGGTSFVVGTAATAVRSVVVSTAAGDRVRVATLPLSAETIRRSRLRGASRVYVAVFPRDLRAGRTPAPQVAGYGADGTLIAGTDPSERR